MKKYYLHNGSEQQGPFDIEALKDKRLSKDTLIWFEGIADWTSAGEIEELKDIIIATPPPLMINRTLSTPVRNHVEPKAEITATPIKSNSIGKRLLILGGIVVLLLIGVYVYNQIGRQQEEGYRLNTINAVEDKKEAVRNNITSYVTAERNQYSYSNMGGIHNLRIKVNNMTDYIIDNVKVKIVYFKTNGDVWDDKIIDFNMLDPRSANTIRVEDTERGVRITYEIISIKSAVLGLN